MQMSARSRQPGKAGGCAYIDEITARDATRDRLRDADCFILDGEQTRDPRALPKSREGNKLEFSRRRNSVILIDRSRQETDVAGKFLRDTESSRGTQARSNSYLRQ